MADRDRVCKACDGTGLLADDENWQYTCTVCNGDGILESRENLDSNRIINVDETNRILD
ncbi:hypothetical protein SAMN05421790_10614 [Kroppenstedtia eburnea]|uniref:Uncharacterized protein n=1 Tax=Kroppenstedtia eburnea TaxID=714067 RepID=A0A1N7MD59_9BACL|nr:hypothetical protein SAMN05421790_10614 [Kroppenstedtia eburnea]